MEGRIVDQIWWRSVNQTSSAVRQHGSMWEVPANRALAALGTAADGHHPGSHEQEEYLAYDEIPAIVNVSLTGIFGCEKNAKVHDYNSRYWKCDNLPVIYVSPARVFLPQEEIILEGQF